MYPRGHPPRFLNTPLGQIQGLSGRQGQDQAQNYAHLLKIHNVEYKLKL